jgi:hypothetical protein
MAETPYTERQIADLRELADAGLPSFVIARALERSVSSVEACAARHAIPLLRQRTNASPMFSGCRDRRSSKAGTEWTPDETNRLRELAHQGLGAAVIACELRRSQLSIQKHAYCNDIPLLSAHPAAVAWRQGVLDPRPTAGERSALDNRPQQPTVSEPEATLHQRADVPDAVEPDDDDVEKDGRRALPELLRHGNLLGFEWRRNT